MRRGYSQSIRGRSSDCAERARGQHHIVLASAARVFRINCKIFVCGWRAVAKIFDEPCITTHKRLNIRSEKAYRFHDEHY